MLDSFNRTLNEKALLSLQSPFMMYGFTLVDYYNNLLQVHSLLYVHREDYIGKSWWSIFRVYDLSTWKVILLLVVVQCLFLGTVHLLEYKSGFHKKREVLEVMIKFLKIILLGFLENNAFTILAIF